MEIINRSRAASKRAPDFAPSVKSARPFIAKKEAIRLVIPLTILTTMSVSCGPQGQEVVPTATEMPKPITDQITEQMNASQPFAGYDTGMSRKAEPYIQEMTPKYGEFKGSTALIGIDADNSRVMSEMFAFEKGVFVLFYNEEGKAVSEMAPVSVNYAYDNKNNLNMVFKATLTDGDSEAVKASFLTLTSGISLDDIAPEVLHKAMAGDKETLESFIQYFDQPEEIIGLNYSNPVTHKSVSMESQTTPSWSEKILKALQAVNPLSVSVVHAAAPAENIQTVEATATVPPTVVVPAINVEVKTAIGEEEYNEIKTGEVKGKDYSTGKDFDGTVEATSVKAVSTTDTNFPNIVTAEATDSAGKKFAVVWNPETNLWVKVAEVNTNLLDYGNYTTFYDTDNKMVESGDFNLIMLARGIGSEPFPANTEQPRNWVVVSRHGSGDVMDYFFYLNSGRMDDVIPPERIGQENYMDIMRARFHQGKEPFKAEAVIKIITEDNKEMYVVAYTWQNADGKNITLPLGFDPRQFQFMFTPKDEIDDLEGRNLGESILVDNFYKLVPIIPTGNPEDWNNYHKAGGNNGFVHGLQGNGINYRNDIVVGMQVPGEVFNLLPVDMQNALNDNLNFIKASNPTTDKYRSIMFPDGIIPPELALKLSRTISEAGFVDGSVAP